MRRAVIMTVVGVLGFLCAGCENRVPKVVGSRASPDNQHILWITNESGGLLSGVDYVHLTKIGEKPEPINQILTTSECKETTVAWLDRNTVVIMYDSIYAGFHSKLRAYAPSVILVNRRDAGRMGIKNLNGLALRCDPF